MLRRSPPCAAGNPHDRSRTVNQDLFDYGALADRRHRARPGRAAGRRHRRGAGAACRTGPERSAFREPEPTRPPRASHLPQCIGETLLLDPDLAAAIAAVEDGLRWLQSSAYTDAVLGEGFTANYGWAEIIGPDGFFPGDDFLLGLLMLGPHRHYRDHYHPAPELYWPLTSGQPVEPGRRAVRRKAAGRHHLASADDAACDEDRRDTASGRVVLDARRRHARRSSPHDGPSARALLSVWRRGLSRHHALHVSAAAQPAVFSGPRGAPAAGRGPFRRERGTRQDARWRDHRAVVSPRRSPGMPTILFFHGNAGEISGRAERMAYYQSQGFGVLFVSYRGYGGAPGAISEAGLHHRCAERPMISCMQRGVAPEKIAVVGEFARHRCCGAACGTAARRRAGARSALHRGGGCRRRDLPVASGAAADEGPVHLPRLHRPGEGAAADPAWRCRHA